VNNELGILKGVLPDAVEALNPGGRLSVITFHSLEDRIVKHYFKGQDGKTLKLIYKKPVICTDDECKKNPRARSAKLRTIEKI
jgi:16S rRNA (cytosine1402-N4)-methyltransferase